MAAVRGWRKCCRLSGLRLQVGASAGVVGRVSCAGAGKRCSLAGLLQQPPQARCGKHLQGVRVQVCDWRGSASGQRGGRHLGRG